MHSVWPTKLYDSDNACSLLLWFIVWPCVAYHIHLYLQLTTSSLVRVDHLGQSVSASSLSQNSMYLLVLTGGLSLCKCIYHLIWLILRISEILSKNNPLLKGRSLNRGYCVRDFWTLTRSRIGTDLEWVFPWMMLSQIKPIRVIKGRS